MLIVYSNIARVADLCRDSLDDSDATTGLIGDWKDEPTPHGILRDSPSGSVFQGDWNE
jgi:hypothetical protein